jgi:hypothetical protein
LPFECNLHRYIKEFVKIVKKFSHFMAPAFDLVRGAVQVSCIQWTHGVALQVAFERQILKPVFSLDRLYVMGLKGYRLWVMGQLDSNVQSPTTALESAWLPGFNP